MGIVYMIKKGYSLVEMLVTLSIISIFTLLVLYNAHFLDLSHLFYINDYLYTQSESLTNRGSNSYKDGIRFNSMGRVNSAKTIKIGNHEIIIHLGTGYVTFK